MVRRSSNRVSTHIRKKKIVSRAFGCTRQSRCSGRNLTNPDAAYHKMGSLNTATIVVCIWTQNTRAPYIRMQHARALYAGM